MAQYEAMISRTVDKIVGIREYIPFRAALATLLYAWLGSFTLPN